MRIDKLRNLWPVLEPKLRIVAKELLGKYRAINIEVEDVLPEALLYIYQVGRQSARLRGMTHDSRRIKACELSYLIQRGRYGIKKYLLWAVSLEYQEMPTDATLFI